MKERIIGEQDRKKASVKLSITWSEHQHTSHSDSSLVTAILIFEGCTRCQSVCHMPYSHHLFESSKQPSEVGASLFASQR